MDGSNVRSFPGQSLTFDKRTEPNEELVAELEELLVMAREGVLQCASLELVFNTGSTAVRSYMKTHGDAQVILGLLAINTHKIAARSAEDLE